VLFIAVLVDIDAGAEQIAGGVWSDQHCFSALIVSLVSATAGSFSGFSFAGNFSFFLLYFPEPISEKGGIQGSLDGPPRLDPRGFHPQYTKKSRYVLPEGFGGE
jgi:hypothetical protein